MDEIGTCNAILRGVKTLVDGSIKVELEINPEDQEIISKLIKRFSLNKRLLTVAFIGVENE
jgi:hypothetical protein